VTAVQVSGWDAVLALVWWSAALVAVWRRPGLAIGLGAALGLWTVAPWASWLALATVAVLSVAWRTWAHGHRVVWPGVGWLVRRPALAVLVVSAGVAALGPDSVGLAAFVVLVAAAAWLAYGWPEPEPDRLRRGLISPWRRDREALSDGSAARVAGFAERSVQVTAAGPCAGCGGRLVVTVRVPMPPGSSSDVDDLGGLVARATCGACGVRLVGVVDDPGAPSGGLVWFEVPAVDGPVRRAAAGGGSEVAE
jgi:hypothetical protein